MDYSARWYSPTTARFTTQDTWAGQQDAPQTLNRYAYKINNPINYQDPSGHAPCRVDGECGYYDWDDYDDDGNYNPPSNDDTPPPSNPDDQGPPPEPPWKNLQNRITAFLAASGMSPGEIAAFLELMSAGADSIPIVSNIKSAIEAFTGYDMFTGQKLSMWERITSGASALMPPGGGTALKLAAKGLKVAGNAKPAA
jgi:hypothetical protein